MGRRGLWLLVLVALGANPVTAQESRGGANYWPRKRIDFPISTKSISELNPKPEKLRLYAAEAGGRFKMVAEKAPDDLDSFEDLRGNRLRGFTYTAKDDGEVTFATQRVYRDRESPRTEDLVAESRVIFDSRPPTVQVAAVGSLGIEWDCRDEYINPEGISLQARYKDTNQKWQDYKDRQKANDSFTFRNVPQGYTLEVRVIAKDLAGNETASRPISLPADGVGGGLPRNNESRDPGPNPNRSGTSFGDEMPNRPAVEYVNRYDFTVKSKLTRVTRSGVKAVHLWMNPLEVPGMQATWAKGPSQNVDIAFNTPDPKIDIAYTANADGLYGFIVIPQNGADRMGENPRRGDPAQILVEVDTKKPDVKIHTVKVSPGGATGAKVDIEYTATDKNLWERPIILEYADSKESNDWKPISTERERNDSRYRWTNVPEDRWKFYVRIRAVDKAGNTGEFVYPDPVIVDLDRPEAVIEKVIHSGSGADPFPARSNTNPPAMPAPAAPNPKKPDSDNKGIGGGLEIPNLPKF